MALRGTTAAGLCVLLSTASAFAGPPGRELRPGDRAPSFVLEDASGSRHALAGLKGLHVILLFGHRSVRRENQQWAEAFQARYGRTPSVRIFMIADMRGVPVFVPRSLIKDRARATRPPVPLLLDWGQKVNTLFGVDPRRIDIFVVEPSGAIALRHRAEGFTDADFAALIARLDPALSSADRSGFAAAATP